MKIINVIIAIAALVIAPITAHAEQWYRVSDDAGLHGGSYLECQRFANDKDPVTHVKENSPLSTVSVGSEAHMPDGSTVMALIINGKRVLFANSVNGCHQARKQSQPELYVSNEVAAPQIPDANAWYVIDLGDNDHFGTCNRLSDAFSGMQTSDQLHAFLTKNGGDLPVAREGEDVVYFQDKLHVAPPLIMARGKSLCDHVADELLKRHG